MVLAVGAAGQFAGLVVPELVKRNVKVRGLVMDPGHVPVAKAHGANEVVVGDLTKPDTLPDALEGVDSVFYIAPAFLQREAEVGAAFVQLCVNAGVSRFVFSSVIHPILSTLSNHAQKGPVEDALLTSGMEYTFLQPTLFFQDYSEGWPQVLATGVLTQPYSLESRFSRVDYRDVAEVAAIALTEDRLLYGTFELCAEGWLDGNDVTALLTKVLGRPIKGARIDPKTAAASAGPAALGLERMFSWYDKRGIRGSALTLRAILGREPRTLQAFFQELASAGAPK